MADVFFSYASEDRAQVQPIIDYLEASGRTVWWDRSVQPGQTWADVIDRELKRARCIVVIWSRHSIKSPWVRLEANKARERKNLVPVIVDDAQIPPEFSIYQAIDFTNFGSEEALKSLGKSVGSHLAHTNRVRLAGVLGILLLLISTVGGICSFTNACSVYLDPLPDRSLAVLEFDIQIPDRQMHGIANVFIDELRDTLAGFVGQQVASRTAMQAVPQDMSVFNIGARLRVKWLLGGSITMSSGKLALATELIDSQTGYLSKGQRYEFPVAELETYRNVIAQDLMTFIGTPGANLLPADASQRSSGEAYVLYLTGKAVIREQHDDQRLNDAARLFNLALALQPGYAEAEAGLCRVQLWRYEASRANEDFESSQVHCNRALELAGRSTDVAVALGSLYLYQGDIDKAYELFERAKQLSPSAAEVYLGLAEVAQVRGDSVLAAEHLETAIDRQPGYWRAFNEFGRFLARAGEAERAAKYFQIAIDLSPQDAGVLNNLGVAYIMNDQLGLAVQVLQKVLAVDRSASAHANLGNAYFWMGNFESAAASYQTAVDIRPDDYRLWGNLADAQRELDAVDEAPAYRRAAAMIDEELRVNPNNTAVHIGLAAISAALGETADAQERLSKHINEITNDPTTSYVVAVTYARLGESANAITWLQMAVQAGLPLFIVASDPAFKQLHGTVEFEIIVNPS